MEDNDGGRFDVAVFDVGVLLMFLDGEDDNEEEDAGFFLAVALAVVPFGGFSDLASDALVWTLLILFMAAGLIGARYVSKTVLRV